MKLNTVRRGTAAAAVLALSLTLAACGEDSTTDTTTDNAGSDTETSAAADPQAQTFGPACDAVPTDPEDDGSFIGMADDPVATAASANPILTQLVGAVGAVEGLGDTLNGAEALTVFAPYDPAFEAIPADALNGLVEEAQADKTGTESALFTVLANHVLGENKAPDAVVGDTDTLAGTTLTVEGDPESGMTVSDGTVTANVLCGNIPTANATVYVIDAVLAGPIS
ncbi:MAG: fasciclin domain-containing protein [Nocardioides sp.]